jgi:hypothetical protein
VFAVCPHCGEQYFLLRCLGLKIFPQQAHGNGVMRLQGRGTDEPMSRCPDFMIIGADECSILMMNPNHGLGAGSPQSSGNAFPGNATRVDITRQRECSALAIYDVTNRDYPFIGDHFGVAREALIADDRAWAQVVDPRRRLGTRQPRVRQHVDGRLETATRRRPRVAPPRLAAGLVDD